MDENIAKNPTNIQVFKNGLILGNLCLTKMNCKIDIPLKRIVLKMKYNYKDDNSKWTETFHILKDEDEDTFEIILAIFENTVKEAEGLMIIKSISLKGVDMDVDIALCTIKETFEQCFYKTIAHIQKENVTENIDEDSIVLDVINEDNKVDFEKISIIHLSCFFDALSNTLLVKYRYKYTGEYSTDFIYSTTLRVLKDNNVGDIIDYYPIFKLAVFAGLNNAKHEWNYVRQYCSEEDAIKEELNKSFLVTYAHIQVFKELSK